VPNHRSQFLLSAVLLVAGQTARAQVLVSGSVTDPQGKIVPGAVLHLTDPNRKAVVETHSDASGGFVFAPIPAGPYLVTASAPGLKTIQQAIPVAAAAVTIDLRFKDIESSAQSLTVSVKSLEPGVDLHNAEVFNKTLFTRDDQMFQTLDAGIDAGQHEGGGKSLEIRRFGFNLDHGGVNGGLKVLLDDVPENQGTQGHGQGYLGALKAISPELIEEVTVVNGPFRPEYGDFSGLGVVHIKQRESLPDTFTARLEGGGFDTARGFLAFSPDVQRVDSYFAYEGSYTDGPFLSPGRYRRDNVNTNYTRTLNSTTKAGFRFLFGRNDFYSSGQIPLDLVASGVLNRFGYVDPTDGGRVKLGTLSGYVSKSFANGDTLKLDGFVGRSLFDLYSDFTYYLNDPVNGDAFQQHDSRLQEGSNLQYSHSHRIGGAAASFTSGSNFHDNQINVGLYLRVGRVPTGVTTRAHAHVTNAAAWANEMLSLFKGRLILSGGVRYDEFRYQLTNLVNFDGSGLQSAGKWQGKGSAAYTPFRNRPLTLHANYGRGINSIDARGVIEHPEQPRIATTDFYQVGASFNRSRLGFAVDAFLIDHSQEQVYIPDDGSFEFKGPSRAYGAEAKLSLQLTRHISLNAGATKIANAFFLGGDQRVYVDSAPHFVANAALTVAAWHGWSGSLRLRAINHYRLVGDDASIVASGHTVLDAGVAKQLNRRFELNLSVDNLTNRSYYETQNYFASRVTPEAPIVARIHGTPGYPLTAVAGVTMHFGGK
jgi:outer membrane receptor protein involved in Fe transport